MTSPPTPGSGVLSAEDTAAARAWIAEVLRVAEDGLHIEITRERGWGDIWRVETGGVFWFKAPHPRLRREVPLRALLEARTPGGVLPLAAGDAERGWQLTADAGPVLAAHTRDTDGTPLPDVGPPLYADLARALARIQRAVPAEELGDLGLPEFDPARAVETFKRESAPFRALPVDHPAHCSAADARRAAATLADLARRWEAVGGSTLPLGLDHNDCHAGNAFLQDGRVLVSDFGDAVLGHPFASMRALLMPLRNVFGPEAVASARHAYLEEYTGGSLPHEQREELLDLAMMLAVPNRLHCWGTLQDPDTWADYADWVAPLWREAGTPVAEVTAP